MTDESAGSPTDAVPFELDQDVALRQQTETVFSGEVTPRWNVGAVPNGGYLMALACAAMRRAVPFPDPLTVTGLYVERAEPGPVQLEVEVLRTGRSQASGLVRLVQEGRLRCHFSAIFSDLTELRGPTHLDGAPPHLPAPLELLAIPSVPGVTPEIMHRFEMRCPPQSLAWMMGRTGAAAELGGWLRFADRRPADSLSLTLVADAFPPAVFARLGAQGWVPTLELTVHVRRRPAPGWLACWFRTRFVTDGVLEEDGEIWDEAGHLVAQSRQLARLVGRRP